MVPGNCTRPFSGLGRAQQSPTPDPDPEPATVDMETEHKLASGVATSRLDHIKDLIQLFITCSVKV